MPEILSCIDLRNGTPEVFSCIDLEGTEHASARVCVLTSWIFVIDLSTSTRVVALAIGHLGSGHDSASVYPSCVDQCDRSDHVHLCSLSVEV